MRHGLAAGEQATVESLGLRLRFGGVRLVECVAQPLVALDRLPAPTETGERIDQHSVQMLIEGARRRERFEHGQGGFLVALLEELRSEQGRQRGMGFGQSFTMFDRPIGVLVLG